MEAISSSGGHSFQWKPFSFFNQSVSQKKIVKVIEGDIYSKLFEIYKETEKGRVKLNLWMSFLLAEAFSFSEKRSF